MEQFEGGSNSLITTFEALKQRSTKIYNGTEIQTTWRVCDPFVVSDCKL